MATCGRNAKWSAHGWQCNMIGIPAVRHSDTGQTGKIGTFLYRLASVCVSVRLRALSRSHFLMDFHQNWHRRKNPEENEFVGGQYRTTPSPILSHKAPILGQEGLKPMQILSSHISALYVRESPKFTRLEGNRGRGTRW